MLPVAFVVWGLMCCVVPRGESFDTERVNMLRRLYVERGCIAHVALGYVDPVRCADIDGS